ncbi:MAG: ABC-F family ATP-binding cassette domain-containing protein [Dehalococcoidia bacterium]|jgi:ATP-binding cassette subfamily F protein 3|nr:ABC-F family ATP-binding cassette domain-containing protein [Dehalococcoidia bacterium]
MLYANKLAMSYGTQELFSNVTFVIGENERVGIVGPNGAGKSTLLRLISGQELPEAGAVGHRGGDAGFLKQEADLTPEFTLVDELWKAFPEALDIRHRLDDVGGMLETGEGDVMELIDEQTTLYERYEVLDGYRIEARIGKVLDGLGFERPDWDKHCVEFSGGWQMRIALAKILVSVPEHALLDEPTNHLDTAARDWLATYLKEYPGVVVIVTHDGEFMDKVVTRVMELDRGEIISYSGNFSAYLAEKKARAEARERARLRQQREIARQRRFIERFRSKATKAAQVRSREAALEKMEIIEQVRKAPEVRFALQANGRTEREVLKMRGVAKAFGDEPVLLDVNLDIERGHKVCLVGENGGGKSTLLRIAVGSLDADGGEIEWAERARPGYYDQHQDEALDPNRTVIEEVRDGSNGAPDVRLRSILGQFLFSGDDVFKPVKVLSGGERSRVALAKFLIQPTNVLLLDEPTNHLDRATRVRLIEALASYDGTIICASHDPGIVDGIATHVYEVKDGEATEILSMRKIDPIGDEGPKTARQRREAKEAREAANTR